MIALDTNVLVRHIIRDDPRQAAMATKLIENVCSPESPGIVTLIVLCELVWVFDRGYRYRRKDISKVLRGLLSADDLRVEKSEWAWQALNEYEVGVADFADYLIGICGKEAKASATYTFDRQAASSSLFKLIR